MLHYKKNDNSSLFSSFNDDDLTHVKNIQNYIPLYKNFFNLNDNNYNSINLNHKNKISKIKNKETEQIFNCDIQNKENKDLFFKFSPLLDPVKYLTGKYQNIDITVLPKFNDNKCHEKMLSKWVSKIDTACFDYIELFIFLTIFF